MSNYATLTYVPPVIAKYFHGKILREEAEYILKNHGFKNGLYLLRESFTDVGSYVLSVCYEKLVYHYKIERHISDDLLHIEYGRRFVGPVELIKYYQNELDGLVVKPTIPCKRPKGKEPTGYLYFSNSDQFNQLVDAEILTHFYKHSVSMPANSDSNTKRACSKNCI